MPDYDIMTDSELNAEVAKHKGYAVRNINTTSGKQHWALVKDNAVVRDDSGLNILLGDDVLAAMIEGIDGLNPASDANEALALWEGTELFYLSSAYGKGWTAWVEDEADSDHHMYYVDARTPARAATICWLMYQDAKAP